MKKKHTINHWINKIVNGTGGFISFEKHELPVFENGRDIALVEFVIRALANIECEDSSVVLDEIIKYRNVKQ